MNPTDEQMQAMRERLRREAIITPSGCWLPVPGTRGPARQDEGRYGRIWVDDRQLRRHVVSFEAFHGPVPEGEEVMHSCDNPPCFNPEHLSSGTHAENLRQMAERGRARSASKYAGVTHCVNGHEFDEANTYINSRGNRQCRRCKNAAATIAHRASRKAARA